MTFGGNDFFTRGGQWCARADESHAAPMEKFREAR
jgi:hypothetical protein